MIDIYRAHNNNYIIRNVFLSLAKKLSVWRGQRVFFIYKEQMEKNYFENIRTSTSGPSRSETFPKNKNLTVEFYKDGLPVRITGIHDMDELADILDTISIKQWEITC